jgi:multicomponent Na+:H+ antiporter subunit D
VARVYWTVFSGPLAPHAADFRHALVWLGVLTALLGAAMCLSQRHLKRLLAFSTVSHVGIFLIGFGLLTDRGLAGVAVYVVAHGMAKAALFMCIGVLLHRFAGVDEHALRGRGRAPGLRLVGLTVLAGGIVLSAAPMLGPFFGKSLIDESSLALGYWWLPSVVAIASAVTGGAVIRVAGRVWMGWGAKDPPDTSVARAAQEDEPETLAPQDRTPAIMVVPAVLLMAGAVVVGLVPGFVHAAEHAAAHFRDRAAYAATVLHAPVRFADTPPSPLEGSDFAYGSISLVGAFAVAWLGLFGRRLPDRITAPAAAFGERSLTVLRTLHSGHVGDYVTWLVIALAALGGTFAMTLR